MASLGLLSTPISRLGFSPAWAGPLHLALERTAHRGSWWQRTGEAFMPGGPGWDKPRFGRPCAILPPSQGPGSLLSVTIVQPGSPQGVAFPGL